MATEEPKSPSKKITQDVPDRRLARAFGFTHNDLNANRAGYLSRGQIWGAPSWMRLTLGWLGRWVPERIARRPRVRIACGRARLAHERREIMGFFRVELVEYFALQFGESGLRFPLTREQYNVLTDGIYYQVYYADDNMHIHSIERAFNQCKE
jgi:hypothetical protein